MNSVTTHALDTTLLGQLLRPYKAHCRYVREVTLEHPTERSSLNPEEPSSWIVAHGNCGVPTPCYYDGNGHFTAVEFNIAYNQLLYAGLTGAIQLALIAELQHWDLEEWWKRQWPDVLIVDYRARFHRPMHSQDFTARLEIREVVPKPRKQLLMLRTACKMHDDSGGQSDAEVLIAIVHV